MQLTESQKNAVKGLQEWWDSDEQNIIISGAPGTGKTFLTQKIVESLRAASPIYTAPTNEAVRQLEAVLPNTQVCKTTYSALGLKLSMRSFKQYIYQGRVPEDLADFNLLIVDEASMADKADKQEQNGLIDFVKLSGMKTIWLGDWAQLPPVNAVAGESPIFTLGYPGYELTEVMRHKGDILRYAYEIRDQLTKPLRNLPKDLSGIGKRKGFIEFTDSEYQKIIEGEARVLCWTNQATKYSPVPGVLEYNTYFRERLFGKSVAKSSIVLPTDKILFASPLMEPEKDKKVSLQKLTSIGWAQKASVNTRAEILKVKESEFLGISILEAEAELENGATVICRIPTKEGEKKKKEIENSIIKKAKETGDKKEAAKRWEYFHTFKGAFADIKYVYAMTGHRAQGSNINEVFVNIPNILQNKQRVIAFKNLYVCATRAKEKLTFMGL